MRERRRVGAGVARACVWVREGERDRGVGERRREGERGVCECERWGEIGGGVGERGTD